MPFGHLRREPTVNIEAQIISPFTNVVMALIDDDRPERDISRFRLHADPQSRGEVVISRRCEAPVPHEHAPEPARERKQDHGGEYPPPM